MAEPLVSILIPCYNARKWIAETLQSALAQTWPRVEIIVVDDGSTDGSREVAASFRSQNVQIIGQANSGAASARNRALQESQGDFIQYLDADDLLTRTKVEQQIRLLQAHPPGCVAVCSTMHFYDGTDPEAGALDDFGPLLGDSDDAVNWLLRLNGLDAPHGGMVQTSAWLTPRSLSIAAGPWNSETIPDDDGDYFNRVLLASHGVRVDKFIGVLYRKHKTGHNLSSAKNWKGRHGKLTALELKADRILPRTTNENAPAVFAKQFIVTAILSYPEFPDLTERALRRWRDLGAGFEETVHFGRLEWVRRLFGWKVACRIRSLKQRILSYLPIAPRKNKQQNQGRGHSVAAIP